MLYNSLHAGTQMLSQDAVTAIVVGALVALPVITSLVFIIRFYCGGLYQKMEN